MPVKEGVTFFSLGVVPSFIGMTMWKEYFQEHPDEYSHIQSLKDNSKAVEEMLQERQKKKLEKIEKYRRLLDEQSTR